MTPAPAVSVVLPTFRRPVSLRAAMDGLAAQTSEGFDWELVVVDNDDPPGCESTVAIRAESFPVPCRYVRAVSRGACHARNKGIAVASGRIIVFCDDDVVPQTGWLHRLVEPVLAGRYEGSAGRVELDWRTPRPRWLPDSLDAALASFAPYSSETELGPRDYVLTANAAFRADLLRATGGMDPVLGPRAGVPMVNDDIDLYRRFCATGARVCFVPAAVVLHEVPDHRLTRSYLLRRSYAQGRSDFRLERDYFVKSTTRGLKSALVDYGKVSHTRIEQGIRRQDVLFNAACDVARFVGFMRESVASLRPGWEGHSQPPGPAHG